MTFARSTLHKDPVRGYRSERLMLIEVIMYINNTNEKLRKYQHIYLCYQVDIPFTSLKMIWILMICGALLFDYVKVEAEPETVVCKERKVTLNRTDFAVSGDYFAENFEVTETAFSKEGCQELCKKEPKCFTQNIFIACNNTCIYLKSVIDIQYVSNFDQCKLLCLQQTDPPCQAADFYFFSCYLYAEKIPNSALHFTEGVGYVEVGSIDY